MPFVRNIYSVQVLKMVRTKVLPFSEFLPNSYLPIISWLSKWINRSYSVPINCESHCLTFTIVSGFQFQTVLHYFTLCFTFAYMITFSLWLYYLDSVGHNENLPIWEKVLTFYYLTCFVTLCGLQFLLHFRVYELIWLLRTAVWIEKRCIKKGL